MSSVLAFVALQGDSIKRSTFEVLTQARKLASESGRTFEALVLGDDTARFLDEVTSYGPSRIHVVEDAALGRHHNEAMLTALERALDEIRPDLFLMPSTEGVKDVLGALAVKTRMAAVPDVSTIALSNGLVEATRPVMAAKFLARVSAKMPAIASARAGSFAAEPAPASADADVNQVHVSIEEGQLRAKVKEVAESMAGKVDLTDARVVVAAGRGVRDEQGKKLIEELAGVFDAAIGSSRAVVENGLFEATTQVGQTGKVVSPDLYFAVGISGAIQHVAGMQNSRVIVAINRDADAPIFQYATYGIVGDLFKILPPLIEQLRAATGRRSTRDT